MRFLAVCLLFVCSVASASPTGGPLRGAALIITSKGYFLLEEVDGIPHVVKIERVIKLDTPDTPTPTPEETIADWAREVNDPVTARALSLVYEGASSNVDSGRTPPTAVWDEIKLITDALLTATGKRDIWQPFRDKLSDHINQMVADGELATKEQVVNFLAHVGKELKSAGLD